MKDELALLDPESVWERRVDITSKIKGIPKKQVALFCDYLEHLAGGGKTTKFLREHNIKWPTLAEVYVKRPEVYALFAHAKKLGEVVRQIAREDEADRRAMDGHDKPVYQGGRLVGHVTEYSDSLLALQLKAGNPGKYADHSKVEHRGVMLNMVIEGIERGTTPPEVKSVKAEDEEDEL